MDRDEIARRVDELSWYHSFDLEGVITPGIFNHLPIANKLLLPERLDGLRCLDAASADGFFAFELKRRGAAEVISLDGESLELLDWQGPPNHKVGDFDYSELRKRFDLVKEVTGLDVKRLQGNIYEISPEQLGTFDLVFVGNVMLHLRNPQAALHALWSVTKGELISYEVVSFIQSVMHPFSPAARLWDGPATSTWWTHNLAGHRHLIKVSGFEILETKGPVWQPFGRAILDKPQKFPHRIEKLAYWLWTRWFGLPSSVVRARPVGKS